MAVCQAKDSLLKQELGHSLSELLPASHEGQKVTAGTELHHEAKVRLRLERVVQLHYVPVIG